jgi:hypothetical protein
MQRRICPLLRPRAYMYPTAEPAVRIGQIYTVKVYLNCLFPTRFEILERRHSSGDTTVIDKDRLKHTHGL